MGCAEEAPLEVNESRLERRHVLLQFWQLADGFLELPVCDQLLAVGALSIIFLGLASILISIFLLFVPLVGGNRVREAEPLAHGSHLVLELPDLIVQLFATILSAKAFFVPPRPRALDIQQLLSPQPRRPRLVGVDRSHSHVVVEGDLSAAISELGATLLGSPLSFNRCTLLLLSFALRSPSLEVLELFLSFQFALGFADLVAGLALLLCFHALVRFIFLSLFELVLKRQRLFGLLSDGLRVLVLILLWRRGRLLRRLRLLLRFLRLR